MGLGGLGFRYFWPYDPGVKPIPGGSSRDTAFDGRFLQGHNNTFTGAANGGGAHGHTDAGHTHIGYPHLHTFSAPVLATGPPSVLIKWSMITLASLSIHGHDAEDSDWGTITYSTDAATIANTDMKPPWLQAILLKPDDIGQDIPDDAVCFGDSATLPTGFDIVAGAWNGKYVIGAEPAAAGGGTGGSATHSHVGIDHDHTPDDHNHAATLCGSSTHQTGAATGIAPTVTSGWSTHHNVTLVLKALADVSQTQLTVQAASSEPDHIKMLGLINTSGSALLSPGVILPFVGAYVDLPSSGGWILCDGAGGTQDCTDKQIKITTNTGEIGDTGGSDTHTHAVDNHLHTHGLHNHGSIEVDIPTGFEGGPVVAINMSTLIREHNHSWSVSQTTPTMQNASVTLSTDDGRFNYRTVIWVKYAPADVTVHIRGGASLLGMTAIAAA